MKGVVAYVLFAALAAVHGQSGVQQTSLTTSLAVLGGNPWVVHLRLAVSNSGYLNTCGGTVVAPSWVVTAASCVATSRYVWIRYGVVTVVNPELVLETTSVVMHPLYNMATRENDIAIISTNRPVEFTANIRSILIESVNAGPASSGRFCGFGATELNTPGYQLSCTDLSLADGVGLLLASGDSTVVSQYDVGGGVVNSEGVLVGILSRTGPTGYAGVFLRPGSYNPWLQAVTGLNLSAGNAAPR